MAGQRNIHDHFFHEAKRHGYVARSAFKLSEIQERKRLIRRGARVLDLGCAPGAWLQVACQAIGPRRAGGCVVGIDLKPTRPPNRFIDDRVRILEGDAFEISAEELLQSAGGKSFDVVLSDMMAHTSGHRETDHYQSINLARRALEVAKATLRPGGHFVVKVFEGSEYPDFVRECGAAFAKVKGFRPKASRNESTEMFVICETMKPPENGKT